MNEGISNIDVTVKTNIPSYEISRIRNGEIVAINADKFYLISLAINISIDIFLKRAYSNLKLVNEGVITRLPNSTDVTSLGAILKPYEDNSLKGISLKTGIALQRLKDLSKKKTAIVLAHELILIEMALGKTPGDLFKELFNDLQLNSLEKQNELRAKEIQKNYR
ncbi:transcriptional regulator with XRE-family HTH domain [Mucilaginibacter sp. SG538B]|uniref:hypothetical protein n=1 Tax=Mucilaginibacter sp. SG538B TaxID=2587021 RepID=UPI00159DCA30|nr:hypothetical protein [Mucilaginibacter sp. SG538B]NVM66896.1 transcriptional regulator with XRE-family HTH domain [Mucilaginibacter sp. SG538B]